MSHFGEQNHEVVAQMLTKLSALWKNRAAVNNTQPEYMDLAFDSNKADFSECLLPFSQHEAWINSPSEIKSQCLSYAWILYNLKTIYIECDIVTPACEDIIKTPPSQTRNRALLQDVMTQALLDEALHTRMSLMACNYIYQNRTLKYFDFNDFYLMKWRDAALQKCTSESQRRLTRFAISCASETLITDYLQTMAEDASIQEICHQVTKTHAMDEWSHSSVFSFVALDIVNNLTTTEKNYLKDVILETVHMFANNELGAWRSIFSLVEMPHAEEIIHDTGDNNEIAVYTNSVHTLLDRIGLGIHKNETIDRLNTCGRRGNA